MTATTPGPRLLLALTPFGISVDVTQEPSMAEVAARAPKFPETFCSQCGGAFGPGDHGYSHCRDHRVATITPDAARSCGPAREGADSGGSLGRPAVRVHPDHPLRPVLTELAAFAAGILPHRIVGIPDKNDALALVDDLLLLCAKVDKVVEAYGDYAEQHFPGIEKHWFKDQLLGALSGSGLYEITSAGERVDEEQRELANENPGTARARMAEMER